MVLFVSVIELGDILRSQSSNSSLKEIKEGSWVERKGKSSGSL